MENRREFLYTTGAIAAGAALGSTFTPAEAKAQGAGELTEHKLPPLPYSYDALEPYIDTQTMKLHHDIHHAGYVRGLNKAEKALAEARASGDFSKVQYWQRELAFNGAGAFLHDIFWRCMTPNAKKNPPSKLANKINQDFGSFDAFKNHFIAAASSVEGSGWGMLAQRTTDKRLVILQIENHQKFTTWDLFPLMCVDVWEHAYYLKYQNRRGEYVKNWWNVINWDFVQKNMV